MFNIKKFITEARITPGSRILLGEADWNVNVDYPADYYFSGEGEKIEKELHKVAKAHNAKEAGAGMGFGYRDISFYGFKDEKSAKAFASASKKIKGIKHVRVSDLDA